MESNEGNPFTIENDDKDFECTLCQKTFNGKDEGELVVTPKFAMCMCGKCLDKYIRDFVNLVFYV